MNLKCYETDTVLSDCN